MKNFKNNSKSSSFGGGSKRGYPKRDNSSYKSDRGSYGSSDRGERKSFGATASWEQGNDSTLSKPKKPYFSTPRSDSPRREYGSSDNSERSYGSDRGGYGSRDNSYDRNDRSDYKPKRYNDDKPSFKTQAPSQAPAYQADHEYLKKEIKGLVERIETLEEVINLMLEVDEDEIEGLDLNDESDDIESTLEVLEATEVQEVEVAKKPRAKKAKVETVVEVAQEVVAVEAEVKPKKPRAKKINED